MSVRVGRRCLGTVGVDSVNIGSRGSDVDSVNIGSRVSDVNIVNIVVCALLCAVGWGCDSGGGSSASVDGDAVGAGDSATDGSSGDGGQTPDSSAGGDARPGPDADRDADGGQDRDGRATDAVAADARVSDGELADGASLPDGAPPPDAGPPPPPLVINEVNCRGEEWLEVFNPGDADVSLAGWVATDDPADPARAFEVPAGVEVPAGGFAVLPGAGALPFGIDCDGQTVSLVGPGGRRVDQAVVSPPPVGATWGRLPDGGDAWGATRPTPGAANEALPEIAVTMNEVSCRGTEWVELHSGEAAALDLGGWIIGDRADDPAEQYVVPEGVVLEPGGFVVLPPEGVELPFGIGCADDTLWLLDPAGIAYDSTTVTGPPRLATWGRLPDGVGDWFHTRPTPGAANVPLVEVPVAINEVQCRGEEWVELYNRGAEAVDLTGWFLSDQLDDAARRYLLPDGTQIDPGEWLVLPVAGALPFAVGCAADSLVLVHGNGQLADRVVVEGLRDGATFGRIPDGQGEWVETVPTPGGANVGLVVPSVGFNEVSCRGESEWFELVNTGDAPVDLAGWAIADSFGAVEERVFIEGGVVEPGGHFVVELGPDPAFGVGCDGDRVLLLDADGVQVDAVEVGAPSQLATWGRLPDADGEFTSTLPTPGGPNAALPEVRVELNEVDCHGRDWVEIANVGEGPADLAGWSLTDALGGRYALDGEAVAAGGLERARQREGMEAGFEFDIDCGADTISLVDPDGAVVDAVELGPVAEAFTWSRFEDGWAPGMPTPEAPNVGTEGAAAILYDATRMHIVDVEFSDDAWAQLSAQPREYVPVRFTLTDAEGNLVDEPRDAQIRVKGRAGSNRPLNRKPAFKLKFNNVDSEARFLGMKRMTLNNMVQDASMIHEWTAYSIFRAVGVPAPRIGYAFLRVNGEDWGLYLNIEPPDDIFMSRHFESTHHTYEGAYGQDLFVDHVDRFEMDDGPEEERDDLRRLAELLDAPPVEGFYAATEDLIEWPEVIMAMATEAYIGHWDGYAPTRNNYYLHTDDALRLTLMPWGCDQTFRQHRDIYEGRGRLLEACLASDACRNEYDQAMVTIMQAELALDLPPKIRALAMRLRPWQERDVRKEYDLARIGNEVEATVAFLEQRRADVSAIVDCVVEAGADRDGDGYICAADCRPDDPESHPRAVDVCGDGIDQDCNGTADDGLDCPDCVEHVRGGHRYLVCFSERPFADVAGHCQAEGSQPLVINGPGENRWIVDRATSVREQPFWVGLSDAAEEGAFVWWDGTPAEYLNWEFGEPGEREDQDCAQFVGFGEWSVVPCGARRGVVCEDACAPGEDVDGDGFLRCGTDCDDSTDTVNPDAAEVCNDDVDNDCDGRTDEGVECQCEDIAREGRTYSFCSSGVSWQRARDACVARGADLVVLDDAAEDTWVYETAVARSNRDYWIGYSDQAVEGRFEWVDGSRGGFEHWAPGQPDDVGGEDCAHYQSWSGRWLDVPCGFALGFICERP